MGGGGANAGNVSDDVAMNVWVPGGGKWRRNASVMRASVRGVGCW